MEKGRSIMSSKKDELFVSFTIHSIRFGAN